MKFFAKLVFFGPIDPLTETTHYARYKASFGLLLCRLCVANDNIHLFASHHFPVSLHLPISQMGITHTDVHDVR